jgi:ribosome-associated protein
MRECLMQELQFRTSRSSGPGGQHVNKTESRVELLWSPSLSRCLDEGQKALVSSRIGKRLNEEGILILASEKYRSQYRNKTDVTERFVDLVLASLVPEKKRRPTRPTRTSIEKRLRNKKIRGEIKRSRRGHPGE